MATQSMFDRLYVTYNYIENGETKKGEKKFSELTDEEKKSITALCFLPVYNKDGSLSNGKKDLSEYISGFPMLSTLYYPAQFDRILISKIQNQGCPNLSQIVRTIGENEQHTALNLSKGDGVKTRQPGGLQVINGNEIERIGATFNLTPEGSGIDTVVKCETLTPTKTYSRPQYAKISDVEKAMTELSDKLSKIEDAIKSNKYISPEDLEKALKKLPTKTQIQNRLNNLVGKITEDELNQIKEAILNINITIDSSQLVSAVDEAYKGAIEKIGEAYKSEEDAKLKKILEGLDKIAKSNADESTKKVEMSEYLKKIKDLLVTNNELVLKFASMTGDLGRVEEKVDGVQKSADNIEAGNDLILEAITKFTDEFPNVLKSMDFSEESKQFIRDTFQEYVTKLALDIQNGHSQDLKEINEKLSNMLTKEDIQKMIYQQLVEKDASSYAQNVKLLEVVASYITDTIINSMDGIKGLSQVDLTNIENRFMGIFNNPEFSTLLTKILNDSEFAKTSDIESMIENLHKLHEEELGEIDKKLDEKFKGLATSEEIKRESERVIEYILRLISKDGEDYKGIIPDFMNEVIKALTEKIAQSEKGMTLEDFKKFIYSEEGKQFFQRADDYSKILDEVSQMKKMIEEMKNREGQTPQQEIPRYDKEFEELKKLIAEKDGKSDEFILKLMELFVKSKEGHDACRGMGCGLIWGVDPIDPRLRHPGYADYGFLRGYLPPYQIGSMEEYIIQMFERMISMRGWSFRFPPKEFPDERDKLIEEYKKQIASYQEENKTLKDEIDNLKEENKKLGEKVDNLTKQVAQLVEELKKKEQGKDEGNKSEKDDGKKDDGNKKKDGGKKEPVNPIPVPIPNKLTQTVKFVADSRKAMEKLAEPKLPWYKRLGNKIKKNPFLATLCGLGVGALVAGAATVIGVGGIGAAIGLVKNASMWFQPTLALLKNVGIGAAAGLGVSGIATIGMKIFGRGSKRERLYNKFKRQYDKCHDYQDKMERHNQKISMAEQKLEAKQEKLAGSLKHRGRRLRSVAKSKRKLGVLRAKQLRQNSEYKAKVQDAIKTKNRLNKMEDKAGKTLAQNGELQKYRKITSKYQAKIEEIQASDMDEETKEQLIDDLTTRLEVKRARHTINADGEDMSKLSDEFKTYDKEASDLIESVKGKKTKLMQKTSGDILKRNSERDVEVEEVEVLTPEAVAYYNRVKNSENETDKKQAAQLEQTAKALKESRDQFNKKNAEEGNRFVSLVNASESTLEYLLKQGKISQAEFEEIMVNRALKEQEKQSEPKPIKIPQILPTARPEQADPQQKQGADAESQR